MIFLYNNNQILFLQDNIYYNKKILRKEIQCPGIKKVREAVKSREKDAAGKNALNREQKRRLKSNIISGTI